MVRETLTYAELEVSLLTSINQSISALSQGLSNKWTRFPARSWGAR